VGLILRGVSWELAESSLVNAMNQEWAGLKIIKMGKETRDSGSLWENGTYREEWKRIRTRTTDRNRTQVKNRGFNIEHFTRGGKGGEHVLGEREPGVLCQKNSGVWVTGTPSDWVQAFANKPGELHEEVCNGCWVA